MLYMAKDESHLHTAYRSICCGSRQFRTNLQPDIYIYVIIYIYIYIHIGIYVILCIHICTAKECSR